MELTILPRLGIQAKRFTAPLQRSLFLRLVFVTVVGLTAANAATRSLSQNTAPPFDPFSPFGDVFPGQPASAVQERQFSCESNEIYSSQEVCTFTPDTGIFSSVEVIISKNVIFQTIFKVRENNLRLGDLLAMFEKPDQHRQRSAYYLWSRDGLVVSVIARSRESSLFLSLWSISFKRESFPGG